VAETDEDAVGDVEGQPREDRHAEPLAHPPAGAEAPRGRREPQRDEQRADEHGLEDRQLPADGGSDEHGEDRGGEPARAPGGERLRDQEERERGEGIREHLDHEQPRVRERRQGAGGDRREQRRPARDDEAGEPVSGEDGRGHRERAQVLDRRVRGGHVVGEPPHRGEQVGVERDPVVGRAAPGRLARLRQRARELRVLDLVAEEPRRRVPLRVPGVEGGQ
jgi:hypothetical protein